jgi:hypothetical protein
MNIKLLFRRTPLLVIAGLVLVAPPVRGQGKAPQADAAAADASDVESRPRRAAFKPKTSAPPGKRGGGASRDTSFQVGSATVSVLAPARIVGATTQESPVIYWAISAPVKHAIEIGINGPDKSTLLEKTIPGPQAAGLHKLDLSEEKQDGKPVVLKPNVEYDVVISIVARDNASSANPTATCHIIRLDPKSPDGAKALAAAAREKDPAKLAGLYAREGIWFDYLEALNGAIKARPNDRALKKELAESLDAEGLKWNADGTVTEPPADSGSASKQ